MRLGYTVLSVDVQLLAGQREDTPLSERLQGGDAGAVPDHAFFEDVDNGLVIRTGSESDLYVLDLDVKDDDKNGLADYQQLAAQHDYEFQGPEAETQSGGRHLYFSLSKAKADGLLQTSNTAGLTLADPGARGGVDIRGEGGIVVASPIAGLLVAATSVRQRRPAGDAGVAHRRAQRSSRET